MIRLTPKTLLTLPGSVPASGPARGNWTMWREAEQVSGSRHGKLCQPRQSDAAKDIMNAVKNVAHMETFEGEYTLTDLIMKVPFREVVPM